MIAPWPHVGRFVKSTLLVSILTVVLFSSSCQTNQAKIIARPAQHSVRSGPLLVLTDFRLAKDHPLIVDLVELRKQVSAVLNLPLENHEKEVVIYLFSNELEYQQFLKVNYPGLPPRRAYFVGTPSELSVYTFWGERIQEDLRHEYTHGLLHSSLVEVPLWFDEGLAEYFEIASNQPGPVNQEYSIQLATSMSNGWRPNLKRLESLGKFSQMQRIDYQESWAWVHFMLHSTPEARIALLDYIQDLRTNPDAVVLSRRLEREHPEVETRFLNYLASMNTSRHWLGSL